MRRSDMMLPFDKEKVEKKLSPFDNLLEQDPYIQKKAAEAEARGEARGEARRAESIQALREAIVVIIVTRFPALRELAQQVVQHVTTPESLSILLKQVVSVSDESTIRALLNALMLP